ncbi:hypothetical protein I3760_04G148400 [Carya illinoinensis]|nr:hypothetical protein I3760_04G148400 [Carya illinoinensis]
MNKFVSMGKEEENPSLSTPSSVNPSIADIPTTAPNFPSYMHGYYGSRPTFSPTFMPYPAAYQYQSATQMHPGYPFQYGMRPPTPLMATSSGTTESFGKEDTYCKYY